MKKKKKRLQIEKIILKIIPKLKNQLNHKNLINDGIIDSFDIIQIISELEKTNKNINKNKIQRSTFQSINSMTQLIK